LARGQHGGGLVENEHAGLAQQRLDDLDPLLNSDRQGLPQRVGVYPQGQPLGELRHLPAALSPGAPAGGRPARRGGARAAPGGTRSPPRCISGVASLRTGSAPSVTFSATVKTGTSIKCWCTMPTRARIASRGEWMATGLSSSRISPSSGWISP